MYTTFSMKCHFLLISFFFFRKSVSLYQLKEPSRVPKTDDVEITQLSVYCTMKRHNCIKH